MQEKENKPNVRISQLQLSLLAVLIGGVAGLGAVAFRALIALFHNLLFLGAWSFSYNANLHTPPSPWGPLVILIPVAGAVAVAFLVKNFAPEAKGHGVPEVMDAIYYHKGIIRPVVAVVKSVASAISIGSGGSIGREGPIIQIGSSIGSSLGQIIPMVAWQRMTLIACGAGSGIAATFNTPIGGVLFALEIIMHEVSVRTLVPVAIATATGTYIGRIFFGPYPSFVIPALEKPYFQITDPVVLLSYAGLGIIMGIMATIFIKSIYGCEDFFEKRIPGNYYTRHMTGMFVVGVIMYLLLSVRGHYYIEGVGYATIQDVLSGSLSQLGMLSLLCMLKLLSTSLTLGSGASGGIFSPSLYMGATLGGAYGVLLSSVFSSIGISPPGFAVAGMAGLVAGATGAAVTAIVMIFEMTLDYNVIIPMTITAMLSYGVRKFFSPESIYTLKLVRRGHAIPDALQINYLYFKRATDFMETQFLPMPAAATIDECRRSIVANPLVSWLLVHDQQSITGLLSREDALAAVHRYGASEKVSDLAMRAYIVLSEQDNLLQSINRMRSGKADVALITTGAADMVLLDQVKGLLTNQQIADALMESVEFFG